MLLELLRVLPLATLFVSLLACKTRFFNQIIHLIVLYLLQLVMLLRLFDIDLLLRVLSRLPRFTLFLWLKVLRLIFLFVESSSENVLWGLLGCGLRRLYVHRTNGIDYSLRLLAKV